MKFIELLGPIVENYKKTFRYALIFMGIAVSIQLIIATAFRPIGYNPLHGNWGKGYGVFIVALGDKPELLVRSVEPDTPFGRTGAIAGDQIVNFNSRVFLDGAPAELKFPFSIKKSDGTLIETSITPEKEVSEDINYSEAIGRYVIMGLCMTIGLLIGLSRGQPISNRWLALALMFFALYQGLSLGWQIFSGLNNIIHGLLDLLITLSFGIFWLSLARQISNRDLKSVHLLFGYLFVVVSCIYFIELSHLLGFVTWQMKTYSKLMTYLDIAPILMQVVLLTLSIYSLKLVKIQNDRSLRDRVFWIALSLCVIPLMPIFKASYWQVIRLIGYDFDPLGHYFNEIHNVLFHIQSIGILILGFAVLKKRIFNFSFLVNRALLYSLLSVILLVVFYATKSGLETIIKPSTTEAGTAISAGVAFLIYLAFHHVYDHVKEYMEQWLFKSWHHNEQQLRGFVRRAAFFEDVEKLREGMLGALHDFGHGCGVAIFEKRIEKDRTFYLKTSATDQAFPNIIGIDHNWVLSMRDQVSMVSLESMSNQNSPSRLVPQFHRGELLGFVLLGQKIDGSDWRPDEELVLQFAVQQIGLDIYALEVNRLSRELEREKLKTDVLEGILKKQ
jgi:hypothetical protein